MAGVSPILVFLVIVVVAVISIIFGIIVIGSGIQKLSLALSAMLAVDIVSGGVAWRVEVMAGGLSIIVFPGIWYSKLLALSMSLPLTLSLASSSGRLFCLSETALESCPVVHQD